MKKLNSYKRLHYSPFDLGIILVGMFCIGIGFVYFNSSFDDSGAFRNAEKFGQITTGGGSRKLGASLQWFDVSKKSTLFYGDVIFANESKDIEIELLEDKDSKLTVPKNSMIKITKSNGEFNLDVSRGSVLINSNKKRRINIRDKRGKIRKITVSKNSRIKFSSKKSNVEVEAIKGMAQISSQSNSKTPKVLEIKQGKLLMVGPKESKVVNKIQILMEQVIDPLFQSEAKLQPKFTSLKTVEVSSRENFKTKQIIPVVDGRIRISQLPQGEFYIREGQKKDYDSFLIKKVQAMELSLNKPKEMYQGDKVTLTWSGRSDLDYRAEIKKGGEEGKAVIVEVKGNSLSHEILTSGNYQIKVTNLKYQRWVSKSYDFLLKKGLLGIKFEQVGDLDKNEQTITFKNPRNKSYRMKVLNQDGKIAVNKVTKKESLKFSQLRPGKYNLKISSPDEKQVLFKKDFSVLDKLENNNTKKILISEKVTGRINIKWKRRGTYPEKIKYKLKIYKDGVEGVFKEETTKKNSFVFETKDFGKYSWEVIPEENDILSSSDKISFEITRPDIGKLTTPQIILKYIEERDCYKFTIPKNKYAKIYDMFIYSSRVKEKGFWRNMYRRKLNSNNDCIKSKGEGKYYYKYRVLDKWNRTSNFTKLGEIYFPISPLDDFLKKVD